MVYNLDYSEIVQVPTFKRCPYQPFSDKHSCKIVSEIPLIGLSLIMNISLTYV